MRREDVFIANVLKCRPPGNRDPSRRRSRPAGRTSSGRSADRAAGDRHARQLRDQADHRQPDRDHQGRGDAAGARARRSHGLRLAALPPRGGLRTPRVAETLREDFARSRAAGGAAARAGQAEHRRGGPADADARLRRRPTSSASSAVTWLSGSDSSAADEALGARIAGELGPATSSWSAASSAAARRPSSAAPAGLGVREPVTSPTFTIGQRYRGQGPGLAPRPVPARGHRGRGAGAPRRLPEPESVAFVEWPAAASSGLDRVTRRRERAAPRRGRPREVEIESAGRPVAAAWPPPAVLESWVSESSSSRASSALSCSCFCWIVLGRLWRPPRRRRPGRPSAPPRRLLLPPGSSTSDCTESIVLVRVVGCRRSDPAQRCTASGEGSCEHGDARDCWTRVGLSLS